MSIYTLPYMRPICYMLVGLPASGKTTWVMKNYPELGYVSSDKYVEQFAAEQGSTYNDAFESTIKEATSRMLDDVKYYVEAEESFVWDQTNLTKKNRATKIRMLYDHQIVAVVFETPDDHEKRLASRPGKNIPKFVLESMTKTFEMPSMSEGFSKIIIAENE